MKYFMNWLVLIHFPVGSVDIVSRFITRSYNSHLVIIWIYAAAIIYSCCSWTLLGISSCSKKTCCSNISPCFCDNCFWSEEVNILLLLSISPIFVLFANVLKASIIHCSHSSLSIRKTSYLLTTTSMMNMEDRNCFLNIKSFKFVQTFGAQ